MANLTITITNRLNVFGGGQPTLWGNTGATTMTWGSDKWGENSEDLIEVVDKLVTNSLSSDSTITTATDFHSTSTDSLTFSDVTTTATDFHSTSTDSLSFSSDITIEILSNGIWNHVFPGGVTNAESRITTDYVIAAAQSASWASPSTPATVWS